MIRVSEVKALEPYRIWVKFTDGLEGTIDMAAEIGTGVFAHLQDPAEFARVYLDPETQTVAWPGKVDLCPDSLYQDVQAQQRAA